MIGRAAPALVSEHVCWGAVGGRHFNDLLPLPYTDEALALMVEHVDQLQQTLQRQVLLENVSSYIHYTHSTMPEWEFLAALARRSGCGLLLDVNNVYVNSVNHGIDAVRYIDGIDPAMVGEIHLAGFSRRHGLGGPLLIDTHDRRVDPAVWQLYAHAIERLGAKPTLIEWDQELPAFDVLEDEAPTAGAGTGVSWFGRLFVFVQQGKHPLGRRDAGLQHIRHGPQLCQGHGELPGVLDEGLDVAKLHGSGSDLQATHHGDTHVDEVADERDL